MSDAFRDLLRKVGSGSHTSEHLTREEAATATRMMLQQEATPAQIGAFMIAHRIKRPTGEELAGMLDAYDQLGPRLSAISSATLPIVMGIPYDGRSRTAPVSPLVTLILAAAGCPIILHGGRRMPTKEGIPLAEIWQALGVDWTTLSLEQVQKIFVETLVGFVYLPTHFPLANELVPYREQIGKRPPFATVELFWCPYDGEALLASGFVHPPTEEMARSAFALRGTKRFMTIKGLEGSCDLPRDRTCIVGVNHVSDTESTFERLLLHPRDYGFAAEEVPLLPTPKLAAEMRSVLQGSQTELSKAAIWNSGFYLWRSGLSPSLESGFTQAEELLASGKAAQKLTELAQSIQAIDRAASIRITENTPV